MNIKQVNEIFRTKYPNGEILQKGTFNGDISKVAVIFNTTIQPHKAYEYKYTSYVDLLNRLGFNVQYNRDRINIINKITKINEELKLGYSELLGLRFYFTNKDIKDKQNYIKYLKQILDKAIFV